MNRSTWAFAAVLFTTCLWPELPAAATEAADDPLEPWRSAAQVKVVAPDRQRHSIHSYFNTCPESPDGRFVLFFTSTANDAGRGEVVVRDRTTGEERVLARDVSVEDAHRAACQQWVSGGRRVVYHDERDGRWTVYVVDMETGQRRELAHDRLAGWSQPHADLVPLYGLHWDPGPHRDLELVNVATGEICTVVTADAVQEEYPKWLAEVFGDKPVSIFFPVLSPDLGRVFFKMATPAGGDARSSKASIRIGKVCYSIADERFFPLSEQWGHPSWHPDSRTVVEKGNQFIDSDTGKSHRIADLPRCGGDHPSLSPDGRLLVTDTTMDRFGGDKKEWGVVVGDISTGNHVLLHQFDNSGGARSWRRSHPHPVFSADGRRLYFNVSRGKWTEVFVAANQENK